MYVALNLLGIVEIEALDSSVVLYKKFPKLLNINHIFGIKVYLKYAVLILNRLL